MKLEILKLFLAQQQSLRNQTLAEFYYSLLCQDELVTSACGKLVAAVVMVVGVKRKVLL